MLIQNVGNTVQASQPERIVNDRPAGNGGSIVVAAPPKTESAPKVVAELPQATEKQVDDKQPSAAQLQNAVVSLNKAMQLLKQNLEFSVDTDTKKQIVKMVDAETGEVIRQIPSEETLAIARSIDQFQQGLLLRQKA